MAGGHLMKTKDLDKIIGAFKGLEIDYAFWPSNLKALRSTLNCVDGLESAVLWVEGDGAHAQTTTIVLEMFGERHHVAFGHIFEGRGSKIAGLVAFVEQFREQVSKRETMETDNFVFNLTQEQVLALEKKCINNYAWVHDFSGNRLGWNLLVNPGRGPVVRYTNHSCVEVCCRGPQTGFIYYSCHRRLQDCLTDIEHKSKIPREPLKAIDSKSNTSKLTTQDWLNQMDLILKAAR
jgi:hypothetical protein